MPPGAFSFLGQLSLSHRCLASSRRTHSVWAQPYGLDYYIRNLSSRRIYHPKCWVLILLLLRITGTVPESRACVAWSKEQGLVLLWSESDLSLSLPLSCLWRPELLRLVGVWTFPMWQDSQGWYILTKYGGPTRTCFYAYVTRLLRHGQNPTNIYVNTYTLCDLVVQTEIFTEVFT